VTATLRAACVIGWPVEHSRSPLIHNYWLARYRIAGAYRRELVPPDEFASFVRSLGQRGYAGGNVTVPHKQAALALAQPDERARAVGAANTLWFVGGVLHATNTDVEGFLTNLDACAPGWDEDLRKATVIGAGGAARAVIHGLITRGGGAEGIIVVNRSLARAETLRQQFGRRIKTAAWAERDAALADTALLVNATTLGMAGQPPLPLDLARLPQRAVVADLVYVPRETPLIAMAKARKLRTADGLGMLLHQAVPGFALWFGRKPEVTPELRTLLEADLDRSAGGPRNDQE
jgi:shikimate dehydrogenase